MPRRDPVAFIRHVCNLNLRPWQEDFVRELFREDAGKRVYSNALLGLPRGNGKTELLAAISLYMLIADGVEQAECVIAAGSRDQAGIAFRAAKRMVEKSPVLSRHLRVLAGRKIIVHPARDSRLYVISAEAPLQHGLRPTFVGLDEAWNQTDRELWDALVGGLVKASEPLLVIISTAGYNPTSLLAELQRIGERGEDPRFLYRWHGLPKDSKLPIDSPETWRIANPALGDFLSEDGLRDSLARMHESEFRRWHLNQDTDADIAYLPLDEWDKGNQAVRPAGKRPAFAGLDLASTTDLTAFVVVSEQEDGNLDVHLRAFIPEKGLRERIKRDRAPYDLWIKQGLLTVTPGSVTDYNVVKQAVFEAAEEFDLQDVSFDRWGAVQLAQEIEAEGVTMVELGQGFASMSAPTKMLLQLILEGKLRHGGNELLRWTAGNTTVQMDAAGNVKPSKQRSVGRIDPIVALIMSIDGWMRRGRTIKRESVYERRGIQLV